MPIARWGCPIPSYCMCFVIFLQFTRPCFDLGDWFVFCAVNWVCWINDMFNCCSLVLTRWRLIEGHFCDCVIIVIRNLIISSTSSAKSKTSKNFNPFVPIWSTCTVWRNMHIISIFGSKSDPHLLISQRLARTLTLLCLYEAPARYGEYAYNFYICQ